jgi:predicted Zn-dependent peptidase
MFEKISFRNGLRLILVPQKDTQSLTVLVVVGTGSKYEKKEENGISHFLEHMYFKGTKKRPTPREIAETLDRVGGIYNAFTSQEYTGFFAKVSFENLNLALDWISDILLNSILPEREIEREKGVIVEEINMIGDNPMTLVENLWLKVLFGDQPAGWPITGTKEKIKRITREKLLKYMKTQYVAGNTVLVIAGNFKIKEAKEKVKKYFRKIKTGKWRKRAKLIEKQKEPQFISKNKETDQFHLILGVRGVKLSDKRRYTQNVLANVLGGTMSSRLFQRIREEMGIAYYIKTESHSDLDSGFLATSAGLRLGSLEKGISEILREYKRISKNISSEELKKAKENLKGKISLLLESSDARAIFFASQELLEKKILTPKEIFREIDKISLSQLKNFANLIFKSKNLNLAIVGPLKKKHKIKKILKL